MATSRPPARAPRPSRPRTVSLASCKGQKLVLFFFPKANTEGGSRDAMAFSALEGSFAGAAAALLGVSADSPGAPVVEKLTTTL